MTRTTARGVVDPSEQCDVGSETMFCNGDCTYTMCGDGYDGCVGPCLINECGDGVLYVGVEQCDDNNMIDTRPATTATSTGLIGNAQWERVVFHGLCTALRPDGCVAAPRSTPGTTSSPLLALGPQLRT